MTNWITRLTPEMQNKYSLSGDWPNLTISDFMEKRLTECPDKVAVADTNHQFTFRQINSLTGNLAASLFNMGIGKGDVVSFQLPNWYQVMVLNLAVTRLGAVINPIVPIYKDREVRFILNQAESKAMIIPANFRNFNYVEMIRRLQPDLPDLKHIIVIGEETPPGTISLDSLLQDRGLPLPEIKADPDNVKLLMYTSGTTAEPKGVQHTHNTLLCENLHALGFWELNSDDVAFMPSPVAHVTGFKSLEMPLVIGCSLVLMDVWQPEKALELIEKWKCTFTVGATPFLQQLLHSPAFKQHDVGSMRMYACGGASVPPELIRETWREAGWRAFRVYGSTEAPTITLGIGKYGPLQKAAETDGMSVGYELRIVDDAHKPVPVGHSGEIVIKGPEVFVGYRDAALNEESFDAEGWFHTGDLGRLDNDGYLEITGRVKDIIIRGGENISAKEIEDLLHMHPGIEEAAVVAMPDLKMGEKVCAYVRLRTGKSLAFEEMVDFLASYHLARQKLPERLEIMDAFPVTASGKVKKNELRRDIAAKLGLSAVRT
ncbi:MAG: AMP-binding protein [Bacillota bacterium]